MLIELALQLVRQKILVVETAHVFLGSDGNVIDYRMQVMPRHGRLRLLCERPMAVGLSGSRMPMRFFKKSQDSAVTLQC